jgi:hypothetical protein
MAKKSTVCIHVLHKCLQKIVQKCGKLCNKHWGSSRNQSSSMFTKQASPGQKIPYCRGFEAQVASNHPMFLLFSNSDHTDFYFQIRKGVVLN